MIWALMPLAFRRVISLTAKPSWVVPKSDCSTLFKVCAWIESRKKEATKERIASRHKESCMTRMLPWSGWLRQRKSCTASNRSVLGGSGAWLGWIFEEIEKLIIEFPPKTEWLSPPGVELQAP